MLSLILGAICLVWYIAVVVVSAVGYAQIYRHYRKRLPRAVSESLGYDDIPHITIVRPVKGLEPNLYQCLAATFHQTYPSSKLTIYFCISSKNDPGYQTLQKLVQDYATFDVEILNEQEDNASNPEAYSGLGPNPKIRNMSQAYRRAKGDIVWIIDCNVWVGKGAAGRMVDTLCGYRCDGRATKKYKFVHQLPISIDVSDSQVEQEDSETLFDHNGDHSMDLQAASTSTSAYETLTQAELAQTHQTSIITKAKRTGGGKLDELFLSSSHAKFYVAINTVSVAPCIVGKSNMFRRSHLDALTAQAARAEAQVNFSTMSNAAPISERASGSQSDEYVQESMRPTGIDFFSHNICEDHLIGDLLWKTPLPSSLYPDTDEQYGKHALVQGDLVIQPTSHMPLSEYIARRARWLRVRKFTVPLATFVEPGTESLLCSAYGAWAMTKAGLPWFIETLSVPQTWTMFWLLWLLSVCIWCCVDWTLYGVIHGLGSSELDVDSPAFVRERSDQSQHANHRPRQYGRMSFYTWLTTWLGREILALPIWLWAVYGGVTVSWRGRKFKVGFDARVRAVDESNSDYQRSSNAGSEDLANGSVKKRTE